MAETTDQTKQAPPQRFRPYPAYKRSGIEWLRKIPTHWEVTRLRRTTTGCQNGVWGEEADGIHDTICVRVADFDRVQLTVRLGEPTIRSIKPSVAQTRRLQNGDLLLEKSGGGEKQPVGAVVIYDQHEPAVCSNFVARVPVADTCNPRYLTYLHATLYSLRINTRSIKQSTGIQNLDSGRYFDEDVALPGNKEQHDIAAFLDRETARIDALVERKERLVELLQEKRAALITRAVTGGLDPNVPMKDSGIEWLGEIPAHWVVKKLRYVTRVGNGSTPNRSDIRYWEDGSHPWLTSAKINEHVITTADQFVTDVALRECHLPSVSTGSVLVALTGEGQTRGRVALLTIDSTISQHLAYLTPRSVDTDARFVVRILEARYKWLRDESSGAGSTRAALTCEFLQSVKAAFPAKSEQSEIVKILDQQTAKVEILIARVHKIIDLLSESRRALISAAVTGKIDVRNEAS